MRNTRARRRNRTVYLLSSILCLTGCAPYADFTLPPPSGNPTASHFVWRPQPAPVLERGGAGDWDSHDALNPSVVMFRGAYWNLYSGFDGKTWSTGLATSPDGIAWQKQGKVLAPDPATWEGDYIAANGAAIGDADGRYWMLYTGRDHNEVRRLGLARSKDGVHWGKLKDVFGGGQPWNSKVLCDATLLPGTDGLRVWFGGGDVAHPVENIHGQIGVAVLATERPVSP